jgi:hypothetical protein
LKARILLILCAATLVVGCGVSDDIKEADLMMKSYFDTRIKTKDAGPDQFYSTHFKQATNQQEWDNIKLLVDAAHGDLQSYEQLSWKIQHSVSTEEISGTMVMYTYQTDFEKGTANESITLIKNEENPQFKILAHQYNSDNIQTMLNENLANPENSGNTSEPAENNNPSNKKE